MSESDLIDTSTLNELKDLLGPAFPELIETYLNDSTARLERLDIAVSANNAAEITHEAHGLKGSSRNLGINGLGITCEKVEYESRDGKLDSVEQDVSAIKQQFAAVKEVLEKYL